MEDMDLENRIVSTGLTETDTDIENSLASQDPGGLYWAR